MKKSKSNSNGFVRFLPFFIFEFVVPSRFRDGV